MTKDSIQLSSSVWIFVFLHVLLTTSASSITDSYGLLPASNLSCYVCSTIDNINCKYLNETIQRHNREYLDEHGEEHDVGNGGGGTSTLIGSDSSDLFSSHHYTVDNDHSIPDLYGSNEMDQSTNAMIDDQLFQEFRQDCLPEEQYCSVIRLGASAPDNVQEFNFFALKRGCAQQCNDGCFIIGNGEKTKLSICSTCCTTNYCNLGNGVQSILRSSFVHTIVILSMTLILLHTPQ